jgi:NADH-quinone oxidoreductase subunit G/NADP-reducing hydrogenase subunit HndD
MEEGYEFIHRVTHGGVLPMITSCSPGWVNMCELKYPDQLAHLSTAKSPQGMFGAVIKTYYAEKAGIDPSKIVSVSVMPCTAKKAECVRPQLCDSGYRDVDISITTRELGRMLRESGVNFDDIKEENFDSPLGVGTGAAVIFGTSGGVMEAALRTVADVLTKQDLKEIDYTAVRGLEQTKEATLNVAGMEVRIAVCNSLGAAQKMMDRVRAGTANYHFIEIMACPGGCIGGGGQPIPTSMAIKKKRSQALYEIDGSSELRKSHDNPEIKVMYDEYFGAPLGEKSHKLLHTYYSPQER